MTVDNKTITYWIDLSEYDIEVAESLFEKAHYIYVGFMCHQGTEKMLKAVYVHKNNSLPPYIHRLDRLIELAELKDKISEEKYDLIDELTPLNIQARYPIYKEAIHNLIDKEKPQEILSKTKELIQWLKTQIN